MSENVKPEIINEGKNKKKKGHESHPSWLNLDKYDFFLSLYVIWFFTSLVIFFDGSEALKAKLGIVFNHEKLLFIYISFIGLFCLTKIVLGLKGLGILLMRFYTEPAYISFYFLSFVRQAWKTYKRVKANFPLIIIYFAITPVLYIFGATSMNEEVLSYVSPLLKIHMGVALFWGVFWSLSPFNFLKHSNFLKKDGVRKSFVSNLVKLDKEDKRVSIESIIKKIGLLKKFITAYEKVVGALSSNKSLFICFLGVLLLVSTHIIVGGTVLLRVGHILSENGSIKINEFFSGSFLDFLYVTINTFLPSELYGIEFLSKESRWILTSITVSSYALLVVAIAGFSMAGSSKVEETVGEFTKDMHGVMDEAASLLKEGDPDKLLIKDKKSDKKSDVVVEHQPKIDQSHEKSLATLQ